MGENYIFECERDLGIGDSEAKRAWIADVTAAAGQRKAGGGIIKIEFHGGTIAGNRAGQAANVGGVERGVEGELGGIDGAAFFQHMGKDKGLGGRWGSIRRGGDTCGGDFLGFEAEYGEIECAGVGIDDEALEIDAVWIAATDNNDAEAELDCSIEAAAVAGDEVIDADGLFALLGVYIEAARAANSCSVETS
ncbi:MAG: hypothetical protein JWQ71_2822 [Pedosphaera sp.]|nr:hypothetical protein [Pedosphaera sp.]